MSVPEDPGVQRAEITRAVRQASSDWAEAMRAHKMAPPDAGFSERLRGLANAAREEQEAWESAHAAGLLWRPIPGSETAQPPHELRPGTGRRGPPELWERFDRAVADLNQAISGSSAAAVAEAFELMADVSGLLADAVAEEDRAGDASSSSRARGAA